MSKFMRFVGQLAVVAALSSSVSTLAWGQTTYKWDDGTAEISLGLANTGGVLAAINYFEVVGGNNVITSLGVAWGTPTFAGFNGLKAGQPFNFHVWNNIGAGTDPNGGNAVLLFSGSGTIDALNIDNNTFQQLAVPNVVITGSSFFVGVDISHGAGEYPFATDKSAPSSSAVSWWSAGTPFNPTSFSAVDIASFDGGNWMIRANAVPASVPEPSTYALLFAGLLGIGSRAKGRRRQQRV